MFDLQIIKNESFLVNLYKFERYREQKISFDCLKVNLLLQRGLDRSYRAATIEFMCCTL